LAKYDPLGAYLKRQRTEELELSFREIENLLGALLPNSAARPQWWANTTDPDNAMVQRKAWAGAAYDAFLIAGADRVRFRRVRQRI